MYVCIYINTSLKTNDCYNMHTNVQLRIQTNVTSLFTKMPYYTWLQYRVKYLNGKFSQIVDFLHN